MSKAFIKETEGEPEPIVEAPALPAGVKNYMVGGTKVGEKIESFDLDSTAGGDAKKAGKQQLCQGTLMGSPV